MLDDELKSVLVDLELTQVTFARLVGVTPRAVNMWVQGERDVPGPVEAYLRIFRLLPGGLRAAEIEKVSGKERAMREGMYAIEYQTAGNAENWGIGTLIFGGGIVYGVDAGEGRYDGTYQPTQIPGVVDVQLKVTFPPNGLSIFGIQHPYEWSIEARTQLDSRSDSGTIVATTNLGPSVVASYKYLRALPEAA